MNTVQKNVARPGINIVPDWFPRFFTLKPPSPQSTFAPAFSLIGLVRHEMGLNTQSTLTCWLDSVRREVGERRGHFLPPRSTGVHPDQTCYHVHVCQALGVWRSPCRLHPCCGRRLGRSEEVKRWQPRLPLLQSAGPRQTQAAPAHVCARAQSQVSCSVNTDQSMESAILTILPHGSPVAVLPLVPRTSH